MSLLKYIADAYDNKNNKLNFYKLYLNNSCVQAHNLVLNNSFLTKEHKNSVFNYFEKIKKFYNSFSYVSRLFKWKKYKHFSLDCDLYGTPLKTLPDNQKIKLIQNKTIYTFRLSDLLSIWNVSLSHSIYLNPVPLIPKNPFTNIKFTNADLVNIFLKTKSTLFIIPKFIDIYWRSLMNMKIFKFEAINILKEKAVFNYIENGDFSTFFLDIVSMINSLSIYLNNSRISINHSYENKNIIVDTLKPYLKTYLLSIHSSTYLKKNYYHKFTIRKLKKFFKDNPTFGRLFVYANRNHNNQIIQSGQSVPSTPSTPSSQSAQPTPPNQLVQTQISNILNNTITSSILSTLPQSSETYDSEIDDSENTDEINDIYNQTDSDNTDSPNEMTSYADFNNDSSEEIET